MAGTVNKQALFKLAFIISFGFFSWETRLATKRNIVSYQGKK